MLFLKEHCRFPGNWEERAEVPCAFCSDAGSASPTVNIHTGEEHFLQLSALTHLCHLRLASVTSGLGAHPRTLYKRMMTWAHHASIVQRNPESSPKHFSGFLFFLPSPVPGNHWPFSCFHGFVTSRTLWGFNCTAHEHSRLVSCTWEHALRGCPCLFMMEGVFHYHYGNIPVSPRTPIYWPSHLLEYIFSVCMSQPLRTKPL